MKTAPLCSAAAPAVAPLHAVPTAVHLPASGGVAEGRAHRRRHQVVGEGGGGSESGRRERDRLQSGLRSVHMAATKSSFMLPSLKKYISKYLIAQLKFKVVLRGASCVKKNPFSFGLRAPPPPPFARLITAASPPPPRRRRNPLSTFYSARARAN